MRIEKKKVKKWSLQELEARPDLTREQLFIECVKNMSKNGWEFSEMADWFNRQLHPDGRPKFLNQNGTAIRYQSCSRAYAASKKRPRKKTYKKVEKRPSVCDEHREFILSNLTYGRPAMEIFLELKEKHNFGYSYAAVTNFIRALKASEIEAKSKL